MFTYTHRGTHCYHTVATAWQTWQTPAPTSPLLLFSLSLPLPLCHSLLLLYTHIPHTHSSGTHVCVCVWLCTFCYARSSRGSKQLLRLPRGCHFCLCCCCCAPSVKTAPKAKWGNFHLSYAAAALLLRRCYCGYEYETHTHTRAKPALLQFACLCMCVCLCLVRARFLHKCNLFSKFRLAYLCTSTTRTTTTTHTNIHTYIRKCISFSFNAAFACARELYPCMCVFEGVLYVCVCVILR